MFAHLPRELDLIAGRPAARTESPARSKATSQKRAGLGCWAVTRAKLDRRKIVTWKKDGQADPEFLRTSSEAIVSLIREWSGFLAPCVFVAVPPQGASFPGPYAAERIARDVAGLLGLPFVDCLSRTDAKRWHGPWNSLKQSPFVAAGLPAGRPVALLVDDLITSGTTMRLSLAALRESGCMGFGFAYSGC